MATELERQFAKLQKRLDRAKTDKAATKARIQHAAFVAAAPLRDVVRTAMPVRTGLARKQLKIRNKVSRRSVGVAIQVKATTAQLKRNQDAFYFRFVELGSKHIKARNIIRDISKGPQGRRCQITFANRVAEILNGKANI